MAVYLLSVVGGWFADRLIGGRRSVLIGGVAIACGHYAMAVPTAWSTGSGLVLIILGTGFLPTCPTRRSRRARAHGSPGGPGPSSSRWSPSAARSV
ncbi:hypothetical protein ACFTZK_01835 [Streptomyces decoyicus]|uniref:hypothetical protein n=1 Tax=Streptomyces decoyicus TaxID=249567 RepID=UPI00363B827B